MARMSEVEEEKAEELAEAMASQQKSVGAGEKKDMEDEEEYQEEETENAVYRSSLKGKSADSEQKLAQEPKEKVEKQDGFIDSTCSGGPKLFKTKFDVFSNDFKLIKLSSTVQEKTDVFKNNKIN